MAPCPTATALLEVGMQTKRTLALIKNLAKTGAPAGALLRGAIRSNAGLRVRVIEPQPRDGWGAHSWRV